MGSRSEPGCATLRRFGRLLQPPANPPQTFCRPDRVKHVLTRLGPSRPQDAKHRDSQRNTRGEPDHDIDPVRDHRDSDVARAEPRDNSHKADDARHPVTTRHGAVVSHTPWFSARTVERLTSEPPGGERGSPEGGNNAARRGRWSQRNLSKPGRRRAPARGYGTVPRGPCAPQRTPRQRSPPWPQGITAPAGRAKAVRKPCREASHATLACGEIGHASRPLDIECLDGLARRPVSPHRR